ncbi:peptidoglycan-binding domain-containing protein [Rhodalgimonas zhirmunskyi]|uniref:Peptidoglycan-binding protein n=1 Tax=Rhodalgimonas zhirmunskyi TaxID=2964767 RepID=A0AAJ1X6W3_9RHOB|nr:peptidoglycan-binding domain-containing protein [Rhodoalgimonas zhirmunskyi]MDQ2095094.1 peptidoglycan-binding protein [Rhodoalgimonas zhirmunskyi]
MTLKRTLASVTLAAVACMPMRAAAADLALILANGDYTTRPDTSTEGAGALADALRGAGWTVFYAEEADAEEMQALARKLRDRLGSDGAGNDRVIIALSGRYANNGRDSWLMARTRRAPDAFNVGAHGLPVAPMADLAAMAPGQAVMIIGLPGETDESEIGPGLSAGIARMTLPQGVTLIEGPLQQIGTWVGDALLDPGLTLNGALAALPKDARARGFRSDAVHFAADAGAASRAGEIAYWSAARDIGGDAGYAAYLSRYPQGIFAKEARAALEKTPAAKPPSPEELAQERETALGLTRAQRRAVQQNLDLLAYNPKGIDGVFGPGTRTALTAWQKAQGYTPNGYLTQTQIAELQRQADVRTAELARERELARQEREKADRAYWQSLGRTEADMSAYLDRYPEGLFAKEAKDSLGRFTAQREEEARRKMEKDWRAAEDAATIKAYQAFINAHPESRHVEQARARIATLRGEVPANPPLERAERQVVPNRTAALLVEQLLETKGYGPGPVDGTFDNRTRQAIARFQEAGGLPKTGYMDQRSMLALTLRQ